MPRPRVTCVARLRIVQLAAYGGVYSGSFVPMLLAAAREARARGHDPQVVFPPAARDRGWLRLFDDERLPVTFAAPSERSGRATIAAIVSSAHGRVVLHSHFSAYDLLV